MKIPPLCRLLYLTHSRLLYSNRTSSTTFSRDFDYKIRYRLIDEIKKAKKELRKYPVGTFQYIRLRDSIKNLEISLTTMEEEKKKESTSFDPGLVPHKVTIDVVSNGSAQLPPCFIIWTSQKTYMFNVPEATSRYSKTLRVREPTVTDIFFTRSMWSNFGGLTGFLLNKGKTCTTRLHGPPKIKLYVETMRNFLDVDITGKAEISNAVQEVLYTSRQFEDAALRVSYVPVFEMSTSKGETNGIAESNKFIDVAFLLELKPPAKKMNPLRIMELKVPVGPLLSNLKAGQTITLPDGRVIQPDDVLEENTSLEEKPTLLVAECSSLKKLPSLTSSSILQPFTNGSKKLCYLVHMTPRSVFETDEYNSWMKSFGEQCTHLVLNGTGPILPHMDGIFQHRYFQRALCPEIFPELYPTDCKEPISQTTEMPKLGENVFMGLPLSRLIMRCKKNDREKYDSDINIDLNSSKAEIDDKLSEASVKEKIDEFRKIVEELPQPVAEYPKFSFLGTASACPTKYRNVSSYLFETSQNCALMIDCGEGTYAQLLTLYGHDDITTFFTKLRAIFVTHAHQDHTQGINTIIVKRHEAFQKFGLPYRPLIIISSNLARHNLMLYSRNFHNLEDLVSYVDCSFLTRSSKPKLDSSKTDTKATEQKARPDINNTLALERRGLIEVTQHFDKDLFTPEEWNLKSVLAVQVIHSQINSSGFVFEDLDGRRVVFSGDTMPCELLVEHGKDADVLVHEATFEDDFSDMAYKKKHSTIGQAVQIGKRMNAKFTILSHFSGRYHKIPALPEYLEECGNVGIAMDHMVVRYGHLPLLSKLIPIYRIVYEEELKTIEGKELNRNLGRGPLISEGLPGTAIE